MFSQCYIKVASIALIIDEIGNVILNYTTLNLQLCKTSASDDISPINAFRSDKSTKERA